MDWKSRVILLTYVLFYIVEDPAPDVIIEQGIVRGKVSKNGLFYEYLGIPYGTTNQESRFQAPLPPPSWDGIFQAVDEHYACAQKFNGIPGLVIGDEDCLKINVYLAKIKQKKSLPVMVYIHGGGFVMGSGGNSIYGGDFIVKHDVILVTFNYRLGPLGFICLGIKEAPGNAGLRDQIAALKWVKRNIASFGGDPDDITLFGESAGAASVSILITSEAAKGLFNKAIMQSGSSISNWAINRRPIHTANLLAKLLGKDTNDPYELYHFLKNIPYKELTSQRVYKPWDKYFETLLVHVPCVERRFDGIEAVITDLPYNKLETGNFTKVPMIIGFNNREGLFMISREDEEILEKRNTGYLFSTDVDISSEEERILIAMKLKKFYFGNEVISRDTIFNMSTVYTDTYFAVPSLLETEILCNKSSIVYNYFFKYGGYRNIVKITSGFLNENGAAHADDIFYLFRCRIWPFWITNEDQIVIDRMTTMWTNFAKFSDPTPQITQNLPVRWEASENNNLKFLYIDNNLKMGPVPNKKAFDLWKDIYNKYRRKKGNMEHTS